LQKKTLRIGAIDSAARGLLPKLLNLFVSAFPDADSPRRTVNGTDPQRFFLRYHIFTKLKP
jgi:DNA-binding transcriptional LysR family regulator